MNNKYSGLPLALLCYISSLVYSSKQVTEIQNRHTWIDITSLILGALVLLALFIYLCWLCKKICTPLYKAITIRISIISTIVLIFWNTDLSRLIIFVITCLYICTLTIIHKRSHSVLQ